MLPDRRVAGAGALVALLGLGLAGCSDSACQKGVKELAALRPDTIAAASEETLAPWKALLQETRQTCAAEKRESALEAVSEVDLAITVRSADLAIEAGARARAAATASAAPPPPPVWTVRCGDVVDEGGFFGLLPAGIPKTAAAHLVAATPDPESDAGTTAPPDEALMLGADPVYLSARGGKLEGAKLEGSTFTVLQSLGWPPEVAAEGATVDRIVAAPGPSTLGVAWVSDLRVFFATLDVETEKWVSFGELPVSGNDGGRDLSVGDLAWGKASFGLTLRTANGFTIVEVLPTARAVRPAALVSAYVAGTPRIAWGGDRFVVAAGRADGEPSMGLWLAPDGAEGARWLPLVESIPAGGHVEPLQGELLAKDGSVHVAFRVAGASGPAKSWLGHASGATTGLDACSP